VRGEDGEVFAPLAQGGQFQRDDVQAEEEVWAKASLVHFQLEIAIAGGDEAYVDRLRFRAAEAFEVSLLQDAQQFDLHVLIEFADLV
jgi:hypothetical protein